MCATSSTAFETARGDGPHTHITTADAPPPGNRPATSEDVHAMQQAAQRNPTHEEEARRARVGTLPRRITLADTVEQQAVSVPDPARDTYSADEWLIRFSP
ncbi:hypothetical protein [Streptomyces sp. NPDC002265]|uniref:hypothetical protein n=1 Tax=Streptomyces sp. NPDC002265 TaxID=3154415 RepID=UPI00332BA520